MAAKQEQVDGLTTPRSKACLLLQASNALSRRSVYIADGRFWALEVWQMGRLGQLAMNVVQLPKLSLFLVETARTNEANVPYTTLPPIAT